MNSTHILQKNGIDLIAAERRRQLEVEGWTPEHDYEHSHGEMAEAAATYALIGKVTDKTLIRTVREIQINSNRGIDGTYDFSEVTDDFELWPWGEEWLKPSAGDPIRNLVKAGALIAAEIDRLLRLKARKDISVSDRGGSPVGGVSSLSPVLSPASSVERDAQQDLGDETPNVQSDGAHIRQNWLSLLSEKAEKNIAKWGTQDFETLGLAVAEEAGELAQAILKHRDENAPRRRIGSEALDLGALCLQVLVCELAMVLPTTSVGRVQRGPSVSPVNPKSSRLPPLYQW